jgi:hypothetical protein
MNIILVIALAIAATVLAQERPLDCQSIMSAAGLSNRFPGVVSHGIHSLTVDALRQFKPTVTEKNGIPTVNLNLTSLDAVLANAPDTGHSHFKTTAMHIVDGVLSHMDNSLYDIKRYSTLEKLVHGLHMQECWYEAKIEYDKLQHAKPSADLCRCATDINQNGVLKMIRFIALQIREPDLMIGKHVNIKGNSLRWDGNLYRYRFREAEPDSVLLAQHDSMPRLTSEAGWAAWKSDMMEMQERDAFELALYLYCALNK